jgi:general secretion pathway protein H
VRQNGFTLLEVLAVIVVISVALTLMVSGMSRGLASVRERHVVTDLLNSLRQAHTLAVIERRSVLLHFDMQKLCYRLEQRPARCLGDGVKLTVETAANLSEEGAAIIFYSDGSSSGGNLRLNTSSRDVRIDVGWLTGSVTLEESRP